MQNLNNAFTDPAAEQESLIKPPRSPAQIAASQANGNNSAGPATPEGRLKCAIAAKSQFQHNQLAETVLLVGESRRTFTALLQNYTDAFQPMNEPEHNAVQKMVVAYWQQLRSLSTHQTAFNCEIARQDATLPHNVRASDAERALNQSASSAAQASRNQAAFERQYRGAMRDLLFLRKLRGNSTGLGPIPSPVVSSVWAHSDDDPDTMTI